MSAPDGLAAEPWRFDFFALMRRLERDTAAKPRIGDAATGTDEFVRLTQEPFLEFPASTVSAVARDRAGRLRVASRFLGMFGPHGALPLATTEEAFGWFIGQDDAFVRFVDLFQSRFIELFFRAWADARPIAQHDRPDADRFIAYLGSLIGAGSPAFRGIGGLPEVVRIGYAGLLAPRVKSAARLERYLAGMFGVRVEVEQFVGMWLSLPANERMRLGARHSGLGRDTVIGSMAYSVEDRIRIAILCPDLETYERFLPEGDLAEPLADAVFLYLGDEFDWEVELGLPASAVKPATLGGGAALGWTGWMAPNWPEPETVVVRDTRFHLAERVRARRTATAAAG